MVITKIMLVTVVSLVESKDVEYVIPTAIVWNVKIIL